SALAGNLGGNALVDLRRQPRIDKNGRLRLSQHVDKARSRNFALGVDRALARGAREIANSGDAPVADPDVARVPRRASPVDNVPVGDHEVKGQVGGESNG